MTISREAVNLRHSHSVNELAYLLRADRPARPVFLLGAGASYRAGIPLAGEAVRRIARAAYRRQVSGARFELESIKPTDWMRWLQTQPWFIEGEARLADNFPYAVQHLLVPREFRREVFLQLMEPVNGLNEGYRHVAEFFLRGLINTALTTNFDPLMAEALRARYPHIREVVEVNKVAGDLEQFSLFGRNQVVYLHGAIELYTDRIGPEETLHLDPDLVRRLQPLLVDSPIVTIGYRGAEASVMVDLLSAGASRSGQYRHGVYWCTTPGTELHPQVRQLQHLLGTNFRHLEIQGFDELLADVASELKTEDMYTVGARPSPNSMARLAADEQVLPNVNVTDLDESVALATLAAYCERQGRAPVTRDNYISLLADLGLLREHGGDHHPTLGCYLLFGRNVEERFPYAAVAVTRSGKSRRVFEGNLASQFHALSEYLDGAEVNPPIRLKRGTGAQDARPFPRLALTEAIVNLLAHRDYTVDQIGSIEVAPGVGLTFRNPASVSDRLKRQLNVDHHGVFQPVRNATEIRNPSIADVFFGIGSMDKAGSGLADVQELMRENGGGTSFAVNNESGEFITALLQPLQAAPGESATARPITRVGVYITNLLPFLVIPEFVTSLPLTHLPPLGLFWPDENPRLSPIFVTHDSHLLSLADLSSFGDFVARRGEPSQVRREHVSDFVADPDRRRLFVWLVGKHVEFYLRTFAARGLHLEVKRHRAYFRLLEGDRNTVVYDSTNRRGIRRDVVKRRGERTIWHENEGIAFSLVECDGTWALQLKPFYMFTGRDGLTPLPPFERTARSTRRIKFDRNRNVDDDLSFWARLLSHNQPVIQLTGPGAPDLVVSAFYQTFEVPEDEGGNSDAH